MQNRPPSEPYLTGNLAEKYDSDTNEYEEIFFDHDDYSLLKNKKDGEIYLKIGDFLALPNELIDLAGELLDDMPSYVRDDLVKRGLIPLEHFKRREKKLLAKKRREKIKYMLENKPSNGNSKSLKQWPDTKKKTESTDKTKSDFSSVDEAFVEFGE